MSVKTQPHYPRPAEQTWNCSLLKEASGLPGPEQEFWAVVGFIVNCPGLVVITKEAEESANNRIVSIFTVDLYV